MTMRRSSRHWAATSSTLALLGASPSCHAFLAGHVVLNANTNSGMRSTRQPRVSEFCMSTMVAPCLSAVADSSGVSSTSAGPGAAGADGSSSKDEAGDPKAGDASTASDEMGRRWIKDMKAGEKVIGYVADTTNFAAFVDVGVVRHGAKGKVIPVAGFLHRSDIKHPYALEKTGRAKTCEVEVKKGIHLTAYVKDVFPNAGRLTLSLDPSMNKDKVLKMRGIKRQRSRHQRRERIQEKGDLPAVGDVVEGCIQAVRDTMLLIDVKLAQLSVLRVNKIRDALGEDSFLKLADKAEPGDAITVRIIHMEASKRRGCDDEKATIEFVGWGGLDRQEQVVDALKSHDVQDDGEDVSSSPAVMRQEEDDGTPEEEAQDAQ